MKMRYMLQQLGAGARFWKGERRVDVLGPGAWVGGGSEGLIWANRQAHPFGVMQTWLWAEGRL